MSALDDGELGDERGSRNPHAGGDLDLVLVVGHRADAASRRVDRGLSIDLLVEGPDGRAGVQADVAEEASASVTANVANHGRGPEGRSGPGLQGADAADSVEALRVPEASHILSLVVVCRSSCEPEDADQGQQGRNDELTLSMTHFPLLV